MNSTIEAPNKENNEIVLPEHPKISTVLEDSTKSALHTNAGISNIDMDVSQEEQETIENNKMLHDVVDFLHAAFLVGVWYPSL